MADLEEISAVGQVKLKQDIKARIQKLCFLDGEEGMGDLDSLTDYDLLFMYAIVSLYTPKGKLRDA